MHRPDAPSRYPTVTPRGNGAPLRSASTVERDPLRGRLRGGRMTGMDVEWGPETAWGSGPRLDEFLLARIAEDERLATTAATGQGTGDPPDEARRGCARLAVRPGPVSRPTASRRRIVLACRESRPDTHLLGARPQGLGDFRCPRTTSTSWPR